MVHTQQHPFWQIAYVFKLAELMGISRNTITNWENDKCRPEVDSIRELCTMLGIPL